MLKEKGGKKIVTIWGLVGILVISAWLLASVTQAGEKIVKKAKVTSYVIKVEVIPVPDVEGHIVGLYERRGVSVSEDGEVAAYHARGTFDFIKYQGPFQGYCQLTYKDGSTTISKYQGTMTLTPGEKLPTYTGKGEYIKGTGRFQGIKGNVSFSGKYITPYRKETKGDVVMDVTRTYTLPSK
jgi:hypothetical protein